ncbi:uncharacterized protein [Diadema antillarum]|uniref:uncharacterized protein n=1 Tax=Diadema antillarum TaxID=105358 RepID=UPI003A8B6EAF
MDQQQSKRPQRLAAARPKTYVPFHPARKAQPAAARNSPPNLNARSASRASPASPVNSATMPPDNSDTVPVVETEGDDVINMAPETTSYESQSPSQPAYQAAAEPLVEREGILSNMEEYFQKATERFERMISNAVEIFLDKLHQLEQNLGASLEFERKRVDDLVENQKGMKNKLEAMEKQIAELQVEVQRNKAANNKNERFFRRNIRLVGIPEAPKGEREDLVTIVEEILHSKFKVKTKVERAYRDGKKVEGRPRHILLKLLLYREKVEIMRRARETLKDERYYITDELSPTDLEGKKVDQAGSGSVQQGTKLKFYSGKWRQAGGILFNFE